MNQSSTKEIPFYSQYKNKMTELMIQNPKPVLLVEDNSLNAMAVRRAFNDCEIPNQVVHLINGEEALKYLKNDENRKPGIILLDLNMPKMNGIEFLKIIKDDPVHKRIPVVILTTSNEKRDIAESFDLNVVGYMIKPVDYKDLVKIIKTIALYWSYSELPDLMIGKEVESVIPYRNYSQSPENKVT